MTARTKKRSLFLLVVMIVLSISIVNAAVRCREVSDAACGNFRNVRAGSIGENSLYRSQHPANGSRRSLYANKLAQEYGIMTVLNLSDTNNKLIKYFNKNNITPSYFYRTLYNKGLVYTAGLSVRHSNSLYRKKVADALKFFTKHKGPYLVHCEVGRDRTGLVILLLECLMGAPYSYMVEDYAQSYVNVNGYTPEKARQKAVSTLNSELSYITGKGRNTDWSKVNLAACAKYYLIKGGMTDMEIFVLRKNLSTSYPYRVTAALITHPEKSAADDATAIPADFGRGDKGR